MPARRVYASWLPPSPGERVQLLRLKRMQRLVILWMTGLIPAGWVFVLFAPTDVLFVPFAIAWIAAGLWFAGLVSTTRCPRCSANFCEKHELPYWYGLFNSKCENCGLSLDSSPTPQG
jgi:hypothetical protein